MLNTITSNHTSTFIQHVILSLHTTYTHIEHIVVVDQFTTGYQFRPTLNFLEDL